MADPVNYTDPSGLSREVPIPAPVRPIYWPGWMTLLGSSIGSYLQSPTIPEFPQTDSGVDCASIMNLLVGGETAFGDLGPDRQLVLQSIIVAGVGAGLDFQGIEIDPGNAMNDRIRFGTDAGRNLWNQIEGNPNFAVSGGFQRTSIKVFGWIGRVFGFGGGHPGMDEKLARQNVSGPSMQGGLGPGGLFLDIDRFNPDFGLAFAIAHWTRNAVDYRSFLNERGYAPCP